MNMSVVRTVEELKASMKSRSFPTMVVDGELASNIVASGILTPLNADRPSTGNFGKEKPAGSTPTHEVIQLLQDLSLHHEIRVVAGPGGPRIKIHPVSAPRREGN
ncbi:MAG: hypothetical protein V1792_02275 [Pseudomonadota bacterium]